MRPLALPLAFAALALAGCAIDARKIGLPVKGPKPTWDVQVSATAGAALVQHTPAGVEALRIACRRNPRDLYIASGGLPARAGPLALEVGGRSFPVTGQTEGPRLTAVGPWPDGLPAALMSGGAVRLALGRETWAYAAPDAKTAAAFAIACRG